MQKSWLIGILLFSGTFLALFLLSSGEISLDSYTYASSIESGEGLFHPHHLAFNYVAHLAMKFCHAVGGPLDALTVARTLNQLAGAMCIAAVFWFWISAGATRNTALAFATGLLLCFGFWRMSVVVEVYIPGMLFLVLTSIALLRMPQAVDWRWHFLTAALLAMAILFHQTNILFTVPMLAWLRFQLGWKPALRHGSLILLPAGLICLGAYIYGAQASGYPGTLDGLTEYVFHFQQTGNPEWGNAHNLMPAGWYAALRSQIGAIVVSKYSKVLLYILLYGSALIALLAWSILALRKPKTNKKPQQLRQFALIWLVVHFLFFVWWLPSEGEFFVVSLFPLSILLYCTWQDLAGNHKAQIKLMFALAPLVILQWVLHAKYLIVEQGNEEKLKEMSDWANSECPHCTLLTSDLGYAAFRYYHHGNGFGTGLIVRNFYGLEAVTDLPDLSSHPGILVMWSEIDPFAAHKGITGDDYPVEWWSMMQALASFDEVQQGLQMAWTPAWRYHQDQLFLRLTAPRQRIQGGEAWLEALAASCPEPVVAAAIRRWSAAHSPILK